MEERMNDKRDETCEADTWFSDGQLSQLAGADEIDALHAPVPTRNVSNGEYMSFAQTPEQRLVEARGRR